MWSATNAAVWYRWPTDPRISRLASASRWQRDGNLGNMPSQLKLLKLFLAYNRPGNSKNPGFGAAYHQAAYEPDFCAFPCPKESTHVCHGEARSGSTAFWAGRNLMVFYHSFIRAAPFPKLFQNQNILTKIDHRGFFSQTILIGANKANLKT